MVVVREGTSPKAPTFFGQIPGDRDVQQEAFSPSRSHPSFSFPLSLSLASFFGCRAFGSPRECVCPLSSHGRETRKRRGYAESCRIPFIFIFHIIIITLSSYLLDGLPVCWFA